MNQWNQTLWTRVDRSVSSFVHTPPSFSRRATNNHNQYSWVAWALQALLARQGPLTSSSARFHTRDRVPNARALTTIPVPVLYLASLPTKCFISCYSVITTTVTTRPAPSPWGFPFLSFLPTVCIKEFHKLGGSRVVQLSLELALGLFFINCLTHPGIGLCFFWEVG